MSAGIPILALPAAVEVAVIVASIVLSGGVLVFAVARREEGFDPMLAISAAAAVALAIIILLTR